MVSRIFVFHFLVFLSVPSVASETMPQPTGSEAAVEALFAPGRDFLDIKLSADAIVDPSVSVGEGMKAVDDLAAGLLPMIEGAQSSTEKLEALRRFIYSSGPWNGYRPFIYDHADPVGKNGSNKLLTHYIRTRLGNCISMPMLAVILGRRIGLKMTLALAPSHVFVKFIDDAGKPWNLEATSGLGFTRDAWYRFNIPMSDAAVASGTYLKPLSEEENAALIALLVIEQAMAEKHPEEAIAIANVILRRTPRNATALIWRGSAFTMMLRRDVINVFPDLTMLPREIKPYADFLFLSNQADFAAAEAVGWSEKDGEKQ